MIKKMVDVAVVVGTCVVAMRIASREGDRAKEDKGTLVLEELHNAIDIEKNQIRK